MQQSDSSRYEPLAAALHHLMGLYGYQRLETPILQPAELFLTRAGDQIISRLFTFERNGKQLALRPEYTSSALSLYCALGSATPARWQFGGIVFEEAQDAPHQQHYSIGAEVFGLPASIADAEIIEMALAGLARAGLADAYIVIGHVALLRHLVSRFVLDSRLQRFLLNQMHSLQQPDGEAHVREQLDRLTQPGAIAPEQAAGSGSPSPAIMDALLQSLERSQLMGGRTREDIQRRLQRKVARAEARPQIEAALGVLKEIIPVRGSRADVLPALRSLIGADETGLALLREWENALRSAETLGALPEKITLAPGLSRNWDYYSGIVFELHGAGRHLGGGGRYDELARLLGAVESVSAVGFAYYVDEMLDALPPAAPRQPPVVIHCPSPTPPVAAWLRALRDQDVVAVLDGESGDLSIDDAGLLHFAGSAYSLTQATEAIAALKEARS